MHLGLDETLPFYLGLDETPLLHFRVDETHQALPGGRFRILHFGLGETRTLTWLRVETAIESTLLTTHFVRDK